VERDGPHAGHLSRGQDLLRNADPTRRRSSLTTWPWRKTR
jgi:hypothetical protein